MNLCQSLHGRLQTFVTSKHVRTCARTDGTRLRFGVLLLAKRSAYGGRKA